MKVQRQKKNEVNKVEKRSNRKIKYRIRIFPIWLRVIVVILLAGISLAIGLMVGYGIIGEGNTMDVFQKETWQHIVDIVKKE